MKKVNTQELYSSIATPMDCEVDWIYSPYDTQEIAPGFKHSDLTETQELKLDERARLLIDFTNDPTK